MTNDILIPNTIASACRFTSISADHRANLANLLLDMTDEGVEVDELIAMLEKAAAKLKQ